MSVQVIHVLLVSASVWTIATYANVLVDGLVPTAKQVERMCRSTVRKKSRAKTVV